MLAVTLDRPLGMVWKSNRLAARKHAFILWLARRKCAQDCSCFAGRKYWAFDEPHGREHGSEAQQALKRHQGSAIKQMELCC